MIASPKTETTIVHGTDRNRESAQVTFTIRVLAMIVILASHVGCGGSRVALVASHVLNSVSMPTRPGSITLMCASDAGIVVGAEKMLIGLSPVGEIAWVRPLAGWPTHLAAAPSEKTVAVTTSGAEVLVGDALHTDAPLRLLASYKPATIQAIAWLDDRTLAVSGGFGCDLVNIESGTKTRILTESVQDIHMNRETGSLIILGRGVITLLDRRGGERRSIVVPTRSDSQIVGMIKQNVFIVEFGIPGYFSMKPKPAYVWTIDTEDASVRRSEQALEGFRAAQLTSGPVVTSLASKPVVLVDWYDEIVAFDPNSGISIGKLPRLSGPIAVTDHSASVVWAVDGNSVQRVRLRPP